jgi:hypothetical protein
MRAGISLEKRWAQKSKGSKIGANVLRGMLSMSHSPGSVAVWNSLDAFSTSSTSVSGPDVSIVYPWESFRKIEPAELRIGGWGGVFRTGVDLEYIDSYRRMFSSTDLGLSRTRARKYLVSISWIVWYGSMAVFVPMYALTYFRIKRKRSSY